MSVIDKTFDDLIVAYEQTFGFNVTHQRRDKIEKDVRTSIVLELIVQGSVDRERLETYLRGRRLPTLNRIAWLYVFGQVTLLLFILSEYGSKNLDLLLAGALVQTVALLGLVFAVIVSLKGR